MTELSNHKPQNGKSQAEQESTTLPTDEIREQIGAKPSEKPYTRILDEADVLAVQQSRQLQIDADAKPIQVVRAGLLRLQAVDSREAINIPVKENIVLGRPDPVTGLRPDIDLTPLAGYRLGVSRRHAEIHWYQDNTLRLYDLGSSNGTFLNGERLEVNKAYTLYNGDEIRLGQLGMYIYYEIQAERTIIPIRAGHGV
jgi:pSer/pThr/pTyr-binding forkhead associated (FHA) protein